PSPYPLVGGAAGVGGADARAGAEEQRPVRAVAGDAGPEGDHGDLQAVPDAVGVADAAVAGLAAQLLPSPLADRGAVAVVVQGLHHLPGSAGGPVSPPFTVPSHRVGRPRGTGGQPGLAR